MKIRLTVMEMEGLHANSEMAFLRTFHSLIANCGETDLPHTNVTLIK